MSASIVISTTEKGSALRLDIPRIIDTRMLVQEGA